MDLALNNVQRLICHKTHKPLFLSVTLSIYLAVSSSLCQPHPFDLSTLLSVSFTLSTYQLPFFNLYLNQSYSYYLSTRFLFSLSETQFRLIYPFLLFSVSLSFSIYPFPLFTVSHTISTNLPVSSFFCQPFFFYLPVSSFLCQSHNFD